MRWWGILGSAALAALSLAGGSRPVQASVEILAEGALSQVEEPFVAVIADAAAYAELRSASRLELPDRPADHFRSHAVLAVFLGSRPTPGYRAGVRAAASGRGFDVVEETPPSDAVLAQVLTSPFVVASVPVDPETGVVVSLPAPVRNGLRPHRIERGGFRCAGGIAGIETSFPLSGEVRLGRLGRLTTVHLDLHGAPEDTKRSLSGILTGIARPDGAVSFGRLYGGGFVPGPCSTLSVEGRVDRESAALALHLASVLCNVADAFDGSGDLVAIPSKSGAGGP